VSLRRWALLSDPLVPATPAGTDIGLTDLRSPTIEITRLISGVATPVLVLAGDSRPPVLGSDAVAGAEATITQAGGTRHSRQPRDWLRIDGGAPMPVETLEVAQPTPVTRGRVEQFADEFPCRRRRRCKKGSW
jgi:hypothetical protein